MNEKLIQLAGFLSLTCMAIGANAATIDFYEGFNGTQTKHCTFDATERVHQSFHAKGARCVNDDIKSAVLTNVPAGTKITLYDDPKGRRNKDDYIEIWVHKFVASYTINDFERSIGDRNSAVQIHYGKDNGLNGKVSYIRLN